MSNTIERLRYFDGEYLRANDFQAEQSYHVAMRRRLNLELHLYGIVEGLQLTPDADSFPPAAVQFSITPGFAIDQQGREIVVDQPYALANDVVLRRKGVQAGTFELWICYQENAGGLPSAGYATCDDSGQNTRYLESFSIVLVPSPKPAPKPGVKIPDPSNDCGGLRLGTITVANNASGLYIDTAVSEHRVYIGSRTQHIVAPDENAAPFVVLNRNLDPADPPPPAGYLDIEPGVYARGNVLMTENAVVGDDFQVTGLTTPPPAPSLNSGNLKISNNVFLNGGLYANVNGKWFGLADYLKTLVPEFVFGSVTIPTPGTASDPSTGTTAPTLITSTNLPIVTKAKVQAGIIGLTLKNRTDLIKWWGPPNGISPGSPLQFSMNPALAPVGGTQNQFNLTFSYAVGPPNNPPAGGGTPIVEIDSMVVCYMVVLMP
jgi:hypothetical protein